MGFQKMSAKDSKRPSGRNCILVYGYSTQEMERIIAQQKATGIDETIHVTGEHLETPIKVLLQKPAGATIETTDEQFVMDGNNLGAPNPALALEANGPLEPADTQGDAAGESATKSVLKPHTHKAIIFNAASQQEIMRFMQAFSSLGMQRPLFAAVTLASMSWRFIDLLKELAREREALKKMNRR